VQYVLILDQWGNWIDTLVWQLKNQGWVYKEFGLKSYAGEIIQINFGTYNDGANGVSSMYVDDVKFEVCP
jgi:bacillopeptidase F (M6 metalloprotease family)